MESEDDTPIEQQESQTHQVNANAMKDQNLSNIRYVVRRSENPHPMTVVIIVLITILVMYFICIQFMRPSVAGIWLDTKNRQHSISHNKYTNEINVDNQFYGNIKSNLIVFYIDNKMKMGVWLGNEIEWTDGDKWQCARGY
jgi:hypothetical protein